MRELIACYDLGELGQQNQARTQGEGTSAGQIDQAARWASPEQAG